MEKIFFVLNDVNIEKKSREEENGAAEDIFVCQLVYSRIFEIRRPYRLEN